MPVGSSPFFHSHRKSTPISFDEENLILKTWSGSVYKICSWGAPRDGVISQLKTDIANGMCEVH